MNSTDFVKNQNPTSKQKAPALAWIIASIMFHLLILLAIMTYKFNIFEQELPKTVRPDDHVVLWTNQQQTPAQQPITVQAEPKQEEKKQQVAEQKKELPKKMPIIIAGKQGLDEQNLDGGQHTIQYPKETTKNLQDTLPKNSKKTDQATPFKKNDPLYKTTPLDIPKGNFFVASIPKQPTEKKQPEPSLDNNEKESSDMYQYVPKITKEAPIKTISFKNLGLGQNNTISTFGNSAHMGIQGDSPDIPTGEELKYITYLNQMANMIVSSMHANPQKNLIHRRTYEEIVFHVKVDRAGNLLTTKIIRPSKHEVINLFILESVKLVGLFNPLPNFITKDTFEINWRISM